LKLRIQQQALDLGFDACRFTTADPPATAAAFQSWIERGFHGDMDYLPRRAIERADLERVLPNVRTVIALAASYASPRPSDPPAFANTAPPAEFPVPPPAAPCGYLSPRGRVARYARYRDYHDLWRERLAELTHWIERQAGPGTRARGCVDTAPILERDLAQRAGVGFAGKHTNLISRQLGNWFFLGEILTTLEVPPDPPEPQRCGTCARCLAACPTGAIVAPFQLDARRCIAYLTIELKGSIPTDLRPAIGRRIFGCDDCLEVCPWNRFAHAGRLMGPHARSDLAEPDLLELLALDDTAFRQRFADTPLARSRRRGLARNVCVALGNTAGPEALPALERATRDPEPIVAEHARWALDRISARASLRPATDPTAAPGLRSGWHQSPGPGNPG
jgi:epoxyqueuosine reductase